MAGAAKCQQLWTSSLATDTHVNNVSWSVAIVVHKPKLRHKMKMEYVPHLADLLDLLYDVGGDDGDHELDGGEGGQHRHPDDLVLLEPVQQPVLARLLLHAPGRVLAVLPADTELVGDAMNTHYCQECQVTRVRWTTAPCPAGCSPAPRYSAHLEAVCPLYPCPDTQPGCCCRLYISSSCLYSECEVRCVTAGGQSMAPPSQETWASEHSGTIYSYSYSDYL